MQYLIKSVREHIEVYDAFGRFLFSADSRREAEEELRRYQHAVAA